MQKTKLRSLKTAAEKRRYLEKKFDLSLANIGHFTLDERKASSRNCENMIGVVQVPLGVAGPLKIKGESARGEFMVPLATTEGALVASVNRGCKAISQDGEVVVRVKTVGVTRGPVFKVKGIEEALEFKKWLEDNQVLLNKVAGTTSRHLSLLKIRVQILGKKVFVRFYFDTKEAMGMNMATIATKEIVDVIEKETGISCLSLAGNFDVDKKPAWLNFISGRGKQVWAEAVINRKVVLSVLKTTPEKIQAVWLGKCLEGSILSGSLAFNSHFANIVASFFAATGQDLAHIVEGSLGVTSVEIEKNGDLFFSIYLPDLMIGTLGGGISLATQKEALSLMGISGNNSGDALKLGEILGGAVLAGELSLIASLAEGSLVRAHRLLARGGR